MSITDVKALIGREGILMVDGNLSIDVMVIDVKTGYGHILYQITPVAGSGQKWVRAERVYLNK